MKVFSGTSGYSYKEWQGKFYPDKLKATQMLGFYASQLPTVEINNTFYRLPKASVLQSWKEQVPNHFRFSIKASQHITHKKRLRDAQEETAYLFKVLDALGDHLGVVLFQLPPYVRKDVERLSAFIETLPDQVPTSFEFRHDSWRCDDVLETLTQHGCAWCITDIDGKEIPDIPQTTDWGYLRLRRGSYSDTDLGAWVERIKSQRWKSAYVFFKHEDEAIGPELATRFSTLIEAA